MDNILKKITDLIPSFSKSQKKIAHYIIENTNEAAFLTAAKLGMNIGVSESTVVRFAGALGYDGFPKLQEALALYIKERMNSADRIDIKDNVMEGSQTLEYVMRHDAEKILKTLQETDANTFNMAVDIISGAKKVYVTAVRSSVPLAEFLSFYLRMIVENVQLVATNSSSEILEQMINVKPEDAVIGISFPRYSMRTLKALEFANDRNAKIITITDSIHSPMNLYSSCNLLAGTDMATVVDSLVAPMSLINALIVALCMKNSGKVVKNLENLNMVWNDYQITNNDEINYLDEELLKDLKGLK